MKPASALFLPDLQPANRVFVGEVFTYKKGRVRKLYAGETSYEDRVKWIRPAPWRFDNCLQASVKFIVASIRGSGAAQPMNMRKTARR